MVLVGRSPLVSPLTLDIVDTQQSTVLTSYVADIDPSFSDFGNLLGVHDRTVLRSGCIRVWRSLRWIGDLIEPSFISIEWMSNIVRQSIPGASIPMEVNGRGVAGMYQSSV